MNEFTMEARCAALLRREIEPLLKRDDMDEDTAVSLINLMVALEETDRIEIVIVSEYTSEHLH